ncbi:hypothetical protein [Streptomyces sp. NPDC088350]|uniref:hypothetical protein n=1 Tax=Streptomyces sp. NPDC088350 TaxID=3365854 RepID=UPI00382DE7E0
MKPSANRHRDKGGNARTTHFLATLEEFKQAITAFRDRMDAEARAFVQCRLPWLYQQGAEAAAAAIGSPFTWTEIHKDAMQTLASGSYADVLRRSQKAERMTSQFYRATRASSRRVGVRIGRRILALTCVIGHHRNVAARTTRSLIAYYH